MKDSRVGPGDGLILVLSDRNDAKVDFAFELSDIEERWVGGRTSPLIGVAMGPPLTPRPDAFLELREMFGV
jgi:hypothetical protein